MRVTFVSHTARLSGAELALVRFLEASTDRLDATVVLAEDGELVTELERVGAEVTVLPMPEQARDLKRGDVKPGARQAAAAVSTVRYASALRGELARLRPDVVHLNSLKAGIYGSLAARAARRPAVWHLHDHLTAEHLPSHAVPPVRLLAGTLPDGLIGVSRSVLRAVGRVRRGVQTAVVPFPVPLPSARADLREEVGVLGIVGRLAPWKGQHVFLEAFARAFPSGPVRARVIGGPLFGEVDYERDLHAQAAALGVLDRVEFTGFRRDIAAELGRLDVVVHASVAADPLPTVVIEALGAGVPVIAADAGGTPEYLRDGVSGLLHHPGDVEDLARAMRRIAGPLEERRRLADEGRAAVAQFAPDVIIDRMLELYGRVVR